MSVSSVTQEDIPYAKQSQEDRIFTPQLAPAPTPYGKGQLDPT
jgi:hypothetical protein